MTCAAGEQIRDLRGELDHMNATTRPISDFKIFEDNLASLERHLKEKDEHILQLEKELRQAEKEKVDLAILLGDMKKKQAVLSSGGD